VCCCCVLLLLVCLLALVWSSHPSGVSPISVDDEALLKLYYQLTLKDVVKSQHMPSKVLVSTTRRGGGRGGGQVECV